MMRVILVLFLSIFVIIDLDAQPVANLNVTAQSDGIIAITYSLSENEGPFTVEVQASTNKNDDFPIIPFSLDGDVGKVIAGDEKKISWNAARDMGRSDIDNIYINLIVKNANGVEFEINSRDANTKALKTNYSIPDSTYFQKNEEIREQDSSRFKDPEPIGGMRSIYRKIEYPRRARLAGIEGRVVIKFFVNPQGKVIKPKVTRGIGAGCDKEAMRVVSQARFKPGTKDGKPVFVLYTLPLTFKLSN